MSEKCQIIVEISMNYIIWMLDHPDELSKYEKLWVETFTQLCKEKLNET